MPYDELAGLLAADPNPVSVGTFPDGSVDDYYRLREGESAVETRQSFAAAVGSGRDSFDLDHVRTDAGGQAINAARQAAALGDDVRLVGHLDHPALAFDFETASMGTPARVQVCLFDADDLLLVEESADLTAWTFDDLRAALSGTLESFLERDALCCANWASVPGLAGALDDVAALDPDGGVFCVDPGPLTERQARRLLDSLEPLSSAYEVVLSVNGDEAGRLAAAAGLGAGRDPTDPDVVRGIRSTAGVEAVAVHTPRAAVAATPEGWRSVPNLDVSRALTETGAGDRFSAALARSLAAGWGWAVALAAGNACASAYVAAGETADRATLRTHVERHRS